MELKWFVFNKLLGFIEINIVECVINSLFLRSISVWLLYKHQFRINCLCIICGYDSIDKQLLFHKITIISDRLMSYTCINYIFIAIDIIIISDIIGWMSIISISGFIIFIAKAIPHYKITWIILICIFFQCQLVILEMCGGNGYFFINFIWIFCYCTFIYLRCCSCYFRTSCFSCCICNS